MPEIKVLSKDVAELIAAGEVVERPASVIKELIENSIDAGATVITVEIQRGGITYMRVTDNGCGIAHSEVPTAFKRHATSKIKMADDLNSILTLGFRGEALAAVSAVAKVEMLTKTTGSEFGTRYRIDGGEELLYDLAGCPEGTTIIVRDLFFNTPARMKFLKKDVSEANTVAAIIDRIALSHPEISFKFLRDGKQVLVTSGDGKLANAVYSVLGRDFSSSLIPVDYVLEHVKVRGLTCKPVACRQTRNNQFVFLNGRFVRSGTVTAAAEQAYKNSAMIGKFPGFVLFITTPPQTVDVNVHPAKTEVRFSDERSIFDAVYGGLKNALQSGDTIPAVQVKPAAFNSFERITAEQYRQQTIDAAQDNNENNMAKPAFDFAKTNFAPKRLRENEKPAFLGISLPAAGNINTGADRRPLAPRGKNIVDVLVEVDEPEKTAEKTDIRKEETSTENPQEKVPVRIIGEAFSTYIVAEMGSSIYMIDKHAAHERIIYNQLKSSQKPGVQALLAPVSVSLSKEDYDIIISNIELLQDSGFEIEDFGPGTVLVRAVPSSLTGTDVSLLVSELSANLAHSQTAVTERQEAIYHTVACKAAIKAGYRTQSTEMQNLAERVLYYNDVKYCPHGRPVAFEIKKRDLEKQFGRIQ